MKALRVGMIVAGSLAAQSVQGPVLGYVVDGASRIRPLHGNPSAAHIGDPILEGVKDNWGTLILFADGTAKRDGVTLEGHWSSLQPDAVLDETGREVLIAGGSEKPWRLTLPERAVAISVSTSGERVLTLLADNSLAAWSVGGKAEFRLPDRGWWNFGFAGERPLAYDPAVNSLVWLDSGGVATVLRSLSTEGGRYSRLAVDRSGGFAILMGESALVIPIGVGAIRHVALPEGCNRLEPIQGGRAFLLSRDPGRPIWVLDPAKEEPLLVIPALTAKNGGE